MDRNGKTPKAVRSDASRNAERSDNKASARAPLGGADAKGGQGTGKMAGPPAQPGRKGHRG